MRNTADLNDPAARVITAERKHSVYDVVITQRRAPDSATNWPHRSRDF